MLRRGPGKPSVGLRSRSPTHAVILIPGPVCLGHGAAWGPLSAEGPGGGGGGLDAARGQWEEKGRPKILRGRAGPDGQLLPEGSRAQGSPTHAAGQGSGARTRPVSRAFRPLGVFDSPAASGSNESIDEFSGGTALRAPRAPVRSTTTKIRFSGCASATTALFRLNCYCAPGGNEGREREDL